MFNKKEKKDEFTTEKHELTTIHKKINDKMSFDATIEEGELTSASMLYYYESYGYGGVSRIPTTTKLSEKDLNRLKAVITDTLDEVEEI